MPPEPPKQFREDNRGRAPVKLNTQKTNTQINSTSKGKKEKTAKQTRQDSSLKALPIPPLESLKIETRRADALVHPHALRSNAHEKGMRQTTSNNTDYRMPTDSVAKPQQEGFFSKLFKPKSLILKY